jgi:hypothetical protein
MRGLLVVLVLVPSLAGADALDAEVDRLAAEKNPGAKRVYLLKPQYRASQSDWPVTLKPGCYHVTLAGGDGVRTLRLSLHDRNGNELKSDLTVKPKASLRHCITYGGPHYVRGKITIGSGELRAGVYEEGAARPAVAVAPAPARPAPSRPAPLPAPAPAPSPAPVPVYYPPPQDPATTVHNVMGAIPQVSVSSTRTETRTHTTSTSNSEQPSTGPGGCDNDFELGSTAMINSRSDIGVKCNNFYGPTNCPTGMFIKLHRPRECVCIARCDEWKSQPAPGQACTPDGSWVCDHYGARNNNHATFCAPANWNLCRK